MAVKMVISRITETEQALHLPGFSPHVQKTKECFRKAVRKQGFEIENPVALR